jgi:hypothetical protein
MAGRKWGPAEPLALLTEVLSHGKIRMKLPTSKWAMGLAAGYLVILLMTTIYEYVSGSGDPGGACAWAISLPWSVLAFHILSGHGGIFLILIGGLVNASLIYWIVLKVQRSTNENDSPSLRVIKVFSGVIAFLLIVVTFTYFVLSPSSHHCSNLSSSQVKELIERAEKGDVKACRELAFYHCEEEEQYTYWDKKASDLGDPVSQYKYSSDLESKKDYKSAIKLLTKSAENNYSLAQHMLGKKYLKGENVSKNISLAEQWLLKASNAGETSAMIDLSKLYLQCFHQKKNLIKSYMWADAAVMHRYENNYYRDESARQKSLLKEKAQSLGYKFEDIESEGRLAALKAIQTIPKAQK